MASPHVSFKASLEPVKILLEITDRMLVSHTYRRKSMENR